MVSRFPSIPANRREAGEKGDIGPNCNSSLPHSGLLLGKRRGGGSQSEQPALRGREPELPTPFQPKSMSEEWMGRGEASL